VPVRVARRQRLGCDETLIGEGRWHPDVDDDRVGLIRFDEGEQHLRVFGFESHLDSDCREQRA